jgi:predicted dehydrogenase
MTPPHDDGLPRLGAAVVGGGFAASSHLDALARLPGVEVAGVLGRSPERSQQLATQFGVTRAYRDSEEMLADPAVDVVHVCTPNRHHAPVVELALAASKHVVCEKPLGLDIAESQRLAGLASRAGTVSAVCFNYRHFPVVQAVRSALRSGAEGAVHLVHGGYLQDWLIEDTDWNWRLLRSEAGSSRAVGDIGSHWLDLVQHVTGDPIVSVCAKLSRLHDERRVPLSGEVPSFDQGRAGTGAAAATMAVDTEDMAVVLLRFASHALGSCVVSQVSAGRKNRLHVEFAAAAASFAWDQEEPNVAWVGRRHGGTGSILRDQAELDPAVAPLAHFPAGHQEGWPDAMRNLMLDVYAAVAAHREGRVHETTFATFDEAVVVARVVEAIARSDREATWVDVDDV